MRNSGTDGADQQKEADSLDSYLQLWRKLEFVRWQHGQSDSAEEDAILDEMDAVWLRLSAAEMLDVGASLPIIIPGDEARLFAAAGLLKLGDKVPSPPEHVVAGIIRNEAKDVVRVITLHEKDQWRNRERQKGPPPPQRRPRRR